MITGNQAKGNSSKVKSVTPYPLSEQVSELTWPENLLEQSVMSEVDLSSKKRRNTTWNMISVIFANNTFYGM